jgi:hypothetical protein
LFVHRITDVEHALALHRQGLNSYAISRKTGIARSTVLHWLDDPERALARVREVHPRDAPGSYAYLLGLYLGDGWIRRYPRTWQLVLTLDSRYQGIVREARDAVRTFTPSGITRVRRRRGARVVDVTAYGQHWLTLFPQHGPGRKHHRRITLSDWQREITHRHPEDLLRGLIQSDGCRVIAIVRAPKGKRYSYARYYFSNRSADIRRIFCDHLDLLSIDWTQSMEYVIQVARRSAVEELDRFVGPKQ